jgi:hypothetical protein
MDKRTDPVRHRVELMLGREEGVLMEQDVLPTVDLVFCVSVVGWFESGCATQSEELKFLRSWARIMRSLGARPNVGGGLEGADQTTCIWYPTPEVEAELVDDRVREPAIGTTNSGRWLVKRHSRT